jgi:hypothetical protein
VAQGSGDSSIQVPIDQVRSHATSVDSVAADLNLAANAVERVHFDAMAYGVFCQALPMMMEPLKQLIGSALAKQSDSLSGTAEDLRAVADLYRARSDESARKLRGSS